MIPQFAQDSICFSQSSPSGIDFGLSTCHSTLSTTLPSTACGKWPENCSFPHVSIVSGTPEVIAFAGQTAPTGPKQLQGTDLYNNPFIEPHQDSMPFVTEFQDPDLYHSLWVDSNHPTLGQGEYLSTSHQEALSESALMYKQREECGQASAHHTSWNSEQPQFNILHNNTLLAYGEGPAPPLMHHAMNDLTPLSRHFAQDELHETYAHEGELTHNDSLVPFQRQLSPKPRPRVADTEGGILVVSEESQDAAAQCTCETQSQKFPCSSCAHGRQSWVMVSYKVVKKPGMRVKKAPNPRKALEEDARRQTSYTRDIGACIRCKIQRVRVGICFVSSDEL